MLLGSVSVAAPAFRSPDLRWTLSRQYRRPSTPFSVMTGNGVRLEGHRLGPRVGGVQAVVSVSTPARWGGHDTAAVRRLLRLTRTRSGRSLLRAWGVRLPTEWEPGAAPADLVSRVAPIPLIIIHGEDDHFFHVEQARTLYGRAHHPKRLLIASRFGHAEDGFTPLFAGRVARAVREALA